MLSLLFHHHPSPCEYLYWEQLSSYSWSRLSRKLAPSLWDWIILYYFCIVCTPALPPPPTPVPLPLLLTLGVICQMWNIWHKHIAAEFGCFPQSCCLMIIVSWAASLSEWKRQSRRVHTSSARIDLHNIRFKKWFISILRSTMNA